MELTLIRFNNSPIDTVCPLFINSVKYCYTLENGYHAKKIFGETRIPPGRRKITLRYEGGMYERYKKRFKKDYPMLWIKDINNFTYVYFHIGNTTKDTEACILVGDKYIKRDDGSHFLYNSKITYIKLHRIIVDKIINQLEDCYVNIIDTK